jgi:hypothetical protein
MRLRRIGELFGVDVAGIPGEGVGVVHFDPKAKAS